jgi:hypothetical protein
LSGCDAERERIADIAGSAGDGDRDWLLHEISRSKGSEW